MSSSITPMALLYSWLGMSDMRLIDQEAVEDHQRGPLYYALLDNRFTALVLLSNSSKEETEGYVASLKSRLALQGREIAAETVYFVLKDPTDYSRIYYEVKQLLDSRSAGEDQRWFHLSPGTPAMAAVWIVLSQSSHKAQLIQTSREQGLVEVELPFVLAARERSSLSRMFQDLMVDQRLAGQEFRAIIHRDAAMKRLIDKAARASKFDVPVLISGESGTGKELLSRAIHASSPRSSKPFVAVNCGAIPSELMESQFFGYRRGAFTGADRDSPGFFQQADGGTLFLDEVGELPAPMQVKLLRALQESEVTPLGSSAPQQIDLRIIAATNRTLSKEISAGRFRSDLYYRLAVASLHIPPLRQRPGDIPLLIRRLLTQINSEFSLADPQWQDRDIAPEAVKLISGLIWPGNVRQLLNCLKQAVLWSSSLIITADEIRDSLEESPESVLDQPNESGRVRDAGARSSKDSFTIRGHSSLETGLQNELDELARRRILAVLEKNRWRKKQAARELGFANHQTLSNWMSRLGIEYTDT